MRAFAAAAALSLVATGVTAVGVLGAAEPATAAPTTATFAVPTKTVWTVPAGVTSITATVIGAAGGGGDNYVTWPGTDWSLTGDGGGGAGALITGTIAVTPGEKLSIWASTQGGQVGNAGSEGAGGAGYSAGGSGGTGKGLAKAGGGGGGASAITRADGTAVIIAAGGGGGAGRGAGFANCKGGHGGAAGNAGGNARENCAGKGSGGAAAGSTTAAGTAGGSSRPATAAGGAGGGGGGYPTGGAGGTAGGTGGAGGGGGGGGSSYTGGASSPTTGFAQAGGNGSVTLSYSPSYATTTTLDADVSTTVVGTSVLFSVTVASADALGGTPTGTVNLLDADSNVLGTQTLVGGQAAFSALTLPLGTHALTAAFTPDTADHLASSGSTTVAVEQGATSTSLSATPAPAEFGEPVTATVTVAPIAPAVALLDGAVTLATVGGQTLGSAALGAQAADGSAQASITFTPAAPGDLELVATFSGNTNFITSADSADLSVVKAASAIALSASPASSVFGQSVTFTAAVSAAGASAAQPDGTVSFFADGVLIGESDTSAGASTTLSTLEVGNRVITASFAGSTTFSGSTVVMTHPVGLASTETELSVDVAAPVSGQAMVFTADVATLAPGAGIPSGLITFTLDGVAVAVVPTTDGTASYTLTPSLTGAHTLTAAFSDGTRFDASSAALNVTVTQAATGIALSSDVNPAVFGQDATITAQVAAIAPGAGTPTGAVDFFVDGDLLASVPLSGGSASVALEDRAVGEYGVTAEYNGDTEFSASAGTLTQTVQQASTTLALAADTAESAFGQELTLTAALAVVAPGAGVPTGTVTFYADAVQIGSATLTADGTAATLVVDGTLTVGARSLTAVFGGDGSFAGSTSAVLQHTVVLADVLVTLDVDASSLLGNSTEFVATVVPVDETAHVPGGFVQFSVDGAPLGAPVRLADAGNARAAAPVEQSASITTDALSLGDHVITAQYLGDAGFAAVAGNAADHLVKPQAPINPVDPIDPLDSPLPSTAGSNSAKALASTGFDGTGAALAAIVLMLSGFGLFAARAARGRRRTV
ncbi:Ig-like domain-containing protein [Microterricola gilva]|uniref:Ig-like domain-containing protein n=1 Tax=Microterricola gilva TaxID=393267 RepID=A0A4Q8AK32_9MICO|nr:Ig-like domain-containing protein [Microterricola gilva]RZU64215.1 Ig-like domain-containing protein [Microterricola gilva]